MGIILFEMSHPVFETTMERHQVIAAIRSPAIVFPEHMLDSPNYAQHVQVSYFVKCYLSEHLKYSINYR